MLSAAATRTFTFDLQLAPRLRPRLGTSGAVEIVDDRRRVRFRLAAPVMIDANGAATDRIDVRLAKRASGWSLTLAPDRRWLDAAGRRWPVVIDPVVTRGSTLDCTVLQDTTFNDCTGLALTVGRRLIPTYGTTIEWRSLLRFDVASAVPPGAHISEAYLRLYNQWSSAPRTGGSLIAAHPVLRPWTSSVSWFNYAAGLPWTQRGGDYGPLVFAIAPISTPQFFYGYMTELVRDWVSGVTPNDGLILLEEFSGNYETRFTASESSDLGRRPLLHITYSPDTASPDLELGGDLRDVAGQPLTGDTYDVWADAMDIAPPGVPAAGVRSVELRLNGTRVAYHEAPCDGTDCDLDVTWDFLREGHAAGQYVISATAVDWAGNATTESFAFDLSPDRTPDPADSLAASNSTATAGAVVACAKWVNLFGVIDAGDAGSRTLPFGVGETTVAPGDGSYLTVRCRHDGELMEAQRVGPIATPEGPRMVPISLMQPSRTRDGYTTIYPIYGDPRDRLHAQTWRRDVDRLTARALPPTPGVRLADTEAPAADDDTSCRVGAELNYSSHAWAGTPWRYYIDRSTFPIVFDTVRKRDRLQERIRDGIRTWNEGRNSCHYRRLTGFTTAMQGTADPGERDEETSVVNFVGEPDCEVPQGRLVLGCTLVEEFDYTVVTGVGLKLKARSADVELRRVHPWWPRRRTRGCTNETDMWALSAHEVGHVVGLDDSYADTNTWQTMYGFTEDCEFRKRTLGRSDWLGLKRISDLPE
jgi:hypothetical protein